MKLIRLAAAGILSCVVLTSFAFASTTSSKDKINNPVELKTLSGDIKELGDVKIKNIIQKTPNNFEKVLVSSDKIAYEKTLFDPFHGANELILNNKDLLRGVYSNQITQDDKYIMFARFNNQFPYNSTDSFIEVGFKDKKTGDVRKKKTTINGISTNGYVRDTKILTVGENRFVALRQEIWGSKNSSSKLMLFKIDEKTLDLSKVYEKEFVSSENSHTELSNFIIDQNYIYCLIMGDKFEVLKVDVNTLQVTVEEVINNDKEKSFWTNEIYNTQDHIAFFDGDNIRVIDKKTLTITDMVIEISFLKDSKSYSILDVYSINGKIYVLAETYDHETYTSKTFVGVYDIKSAKALFEGELSNGQSFGLVYSYEFVK